jgi:ribosome-binding factor A
MTHRIEKIESTLARAIQQVISQGLHDPRASGLISVLRVDISPDMASAMVFVSIYPEERSELTMHALRHAARHIRHQAADLIAIRRVPVIEFRLDRSLKHQAEVFGALAKARDQTPMSPEDPTETEPEPGAAPPDARDPTPEAANDPSAPAQPTSPWVKRPGKEP